MSAAYKDASQPIDRRVDDLLSRMSDREKIAQLCSVIIPFGAQPITEVNGCQQPTPEIRVALAEGLGGIAYLHMGARVAEGVRCTRVLQKYAVENTRLGIPLLLFEEALTGFVAYQSTQFPSAQNLAATFDPALVERCFNAIGREARARGATMVLAPVADLGRDPRWGRVQETFGEDTYLVSQMTVAAVRGLQGGPDGPGPTHVAATLKHFAGFGQSDGGRQMAPVNIGPNKLNNEILPPFRAGIRDARAAAVMAAYHEIDGVPCHANQWLLHTVLRERWGFDGLVVADFGGIEHLIGMHGVAVDLHQAARMALTAGVDMDLPSGTGYQLLLSDIQADSVLRERIEQAVRRVLVLKMRLGLFENPYPRDDAEAVVSCDAHQELSLACAERSIILLRNEGGLLPLDPHRLRRVACIGPHADLPHLGPDRRRMTTILAGLRAELGTSVEVVYAHGCGLTTKDGKPPVYLEETASTALTELQKIDTNAALAELYRQDRPQIIPLEYERGLITQAAQVAAESDVVVLCLGESSWCIGENYAANRRGDRDSIDLIGNQMELFRAVKATGRPVVVVLVHTRALGLGEIVHEADAILDIWDPGERRGTAVARVILGRAEPCGRLPVTIPLTVGQIPCYYSQKPTAYTRTYAFRDDYVAYPFGFGLSYTTFALESAALSKSRAGVGEHIRALAVIVNRGKRAGTAVVQAYIRALCTRITRPLWELKAFCRVELEPGESRTAELELSSNAFAVVNHDGEEVVQPGAFRVGIGLDSAHLTELELTLV